MDAVQYYREMLKVWSHSSGNESKTGSKLWSHSNVPPFPQKNWNHECGLSVTKTGTPTIEERKKDIDQMNSRI